MGRGSPREHLPPRPAFFRAAIAIGRLAEGFAQRSSLRRVREREVCGRLNERPVRVAWGLQIVQVAHRSQQARFAGAMGGRHRLAERLRSQGRKARVRSPSFS